MPHEQLWAPWRLGYIAGTDQAKQRPDDQLDWLPGADRACFMCRALADTHDRENLLVARGERTMVVLNRYPYNNGHLLIAPRRHLGRLSELDEAEHVALISEIARFVDVIERTMSAEGFNVGLNLGRAAGAGVPGHLHWHVVPRWSGDSNFMASVDAVRVIPQALDALWVLLREALGQTA